MSKPYPRYAECTNCGKQIVKESKDANWEHVIPTEGLRAFACRVITIATPRRGSIR
jgi:hypothetical protein